jgi:iron complex transport system permease protein
MIKKPLLHGVTFFCLTLCWIAGIILACSLGKVQISFLDVLLILLKRIPLVGNYLQHLDFPQSQFNSIFVVRLPRAILALLVGAGLACSGAAFQGLFKNPLADPYFIGVSAGAAFGGTLAIVLGISQILDVGGIGISAFVFAIITVFIVYRLALGGGKAATFNLVLAGIAVSAFLTACVSLLMTLHKEKIGEIIAWTMGSFEYSTWEEVQMFALILLIGLGGMFVFARDLNVLLSGEESAHTLGVPVEKVKFTLLILASLLGASATAVSGIIWFVGLIVPHTVRLLIGSDYKLLLPYSALGGGLFLLTADILARLSLSAEELPVGVITALFGAPFFLYLLLKSKREYFS